MTNITRLRDGTVISFGTTPVVVIVIVAAAGAVGSDGLPPQIIPEGLFDATTQAVLLESSVTLHDRHTWFGRAEVVEKPAHDLHAHEYPDSVFTVGKLQGGYTRYMRPWHGLSAGIGATVSISLVPSELSAQYHGRVIPGLGIFLNLRPSRHAM